MDTHLKATGAALLDLVSVEVIHQGQCRLSTIDLIAAWKRSLKLTSAHSVGHGQPCHSETLTDRRFVSRMNPV